MKLGLVGSGNTTAATALALAAGHPFDEIIWVARIPEKATAALRDVASAYPAFLQKVRVQESFRGEQPDIIALTAGSQIPVGGTPRDGLKENVAIAESFLKGAVGPQTVVVLLASPVDEVTEEIALQLDLPRKQVIGFGGDLDVRRLSVVLGETRQAGKPVHVIGEHGSRAIPVYEGEEGFEETAKNVRLMFKALTHLTGAPRNLATGVLMAELLRSLARPIPSLHYVNAYRAEQKMFLTWPTLVACGGVVETVNIALGPMAQKALDDLIAAKTADREIRNRILLA